MQPIVDLNDVLMFRFVDLKNTRDPILVLREAGKMYNIMRQQGNPNIREQAKRIIIGIWMYQVEMDISHQHDYRDDIDIRKTLINKGIRIAPRRLSCYF